MSITVESHYEYGDLLGRINDALEQAGLGHGPITWSDLTPLDQFHVGGLPATARLVEALHPRPSDKVLDVGSGLGGPTRFVQATYGCDVTGIDLTAPYIEVSKMLAERTGQAEHLHYKQANALDLPFDDASFDIVMTQHVAMNIADRQRLYREMRRVLKPGGKLGLYDVAAGNGEPLTFPVPWARVPEISHLLTADQTRATVVAAGFDEVSFQDTTAEALDWFATMLMALKEAAVKPAMGLQVVMGPEFAGMAANLNHALLDGRVRVIQATFRRNLVS